jgi:multimeric flavodoxin WrbA
MMAKKMLIFNGSPRKAGTSFRFAETIRDLAEEAGCRGEIFHVIDCFDGKCDFGDVCDKMTQSDILCLVAPLYADTLPYPVLWFLEKLAGEYGNELRGKGFCAVGQHGFPDIAVCGPLLATCQCFAAATGMQWLGGLAYGSGAMLNGTPLTELGRKGEKITAAFKLALDEIIAGQPIGPQPQAMLKQAGAIPRIFYGLIAAYLNSKARKTARELGVGDFISPTYLVNLKTTITTGDGEKR